MERILVWVSVGAFFAYGGMLAVRAFLGTDAVPLSIPAATVTFVAILVAYAVVAVTARIRGSR